MQITVEKEFCFVQSETSQIGEFPPNNSLRIKTWLIGRCFDFSCWELWQFVCCNMEYKTISKFLDIPILSYTPQWQVCDTKPEFSGKPPPLCLQLLSRGKKGSLALLPSRGKGNEGSASALGRGCMCPLCPAKAEQGITHQSWPLAFPTCGGGLFPTEGGRR